MLAMTLLLLAVLFALSINVFAQAPSRQSVTMTAGSGTLTYSAGIQNPAFNMFKVTAVIIPSALTTGGTNAIPTTNKVFAVNGTVTNLLGTITPTAGANVLMITNQWWNFTGDKLIITSSDTNTITAAAIIEEK
jgi:hypothetical protein